MWQGILTYTHAGKDLMVILDKETGAPNPDPDAAWREAQEFLQEARKANPEGAVLDICLRHSSYRPDSGRPGIDLIFEDSHGIDLVFS